MKIIAVRSDDTGKNVDVSFQVNLKITLLYSLEKILMPKKEGE